MESEIDTQEGELGNNMDEDIDQIKAQPTPRCKNSPCWPLVVYIAITVLALIIILAVPNLDSSSKATTFVISLAWAVFWGFVLWWLCRFCHWAWAWFLLFLPFIINVFFIIIVLLAVGAFDVAGSFPSSIQITGDDD